MQFVWILTGRAPFWSAQHPISIASAPVEGGAIELLIKALGAWSGGTVPALETGARVWVDGPFGGFVPSDASGSRLVLIAGGIGIAPMRSILHAMRDRRDSRAVTLIQAAAHASRLAPGDEMAAWPGDTTLGVPGSRIHTERFQMV